MNTFKIITYTDVAYSSLLEMLDAISGLKDIQYHNPVIAYEDNVPVMIIRTSDSLETIQLAIASHCDDIVRTIVTQ